jgi:LmbE family N-acetylglucosaminyl deacetylase
MKKILVMAPHADDEVLGCGGVLNKFKSKKIYWMLLTQIRFANKQYNKKLINQKNLEIEKIAKKIGVKKLFKLGFEATKLNNKDLPNLIDSISTILKKIKPDTIFAPYLHDAHSDHFFTTYALNHILKSFRYDFVERCYLYETLSETNLSFVKNKKFKPNVYFDISNNINSKIELLKIYKSEIKKHPFPRSQQSVKSLALLRGSESNYKYAEAFQLILERKK